MKKEEIIKSLNVDPKIGLTSKEVEKRRSLSGYNKLDEKKRTPMIIRFFAQFKDVLILILIAAAIIQLIIDFEHNWFEGLIIIAIVLINALLGVIQESKAEKSLEALKKLSSPHAKVIRDGKLVEIKSEELVPGDILYIEAGDFVPADCRIIEASNLRVDESALTGESVSVMKHHNDIDKEDIPLGDQKNNLFSSTFVTYGKGTAVVTAIGMKTEIGKIANMLLESKEDSTPLQNKLAQIGKTIGVFALAVCVVVFVLEYINHTDQPMNAFTTAIALAVAAIPEGLATVVTVVLAIGVEKMAKEKAIVKKLPAVETLGSTSIICSDKTGTLTQNKMTVVKVFKKELKDLSADLPEDIKEMLTYFSLCTDASIDVIDGVEKRIGDPTETALIEVNNKFGLYKDDIKNKFKRLADLPFDSERKMMTTIVDYNGVILSITKGAFDILLERSKYFFNKEKIKEANDLMASNALRVLGLGIKVLKEVPKELISENLENDLEFIGLVGMIDPARDEVKDAIEVAKKAGIRTIMITGDHVETAKAIAKELKILNEGEEAISSLELKNMSDEELGNNIEKYSVYARVSPEDKVRIVKAWQSKNMVVSMTGDGVNDSPALKQADIGCAMGITGTDVAKEASSMILVDDNYSTIVKAVKQGRGIYSNIKKVVHYLLSSNIGEVFTIFVATVISIILNKSGIIDYPLPVALMAIHLLWINLVTDSLPAFALGMEEANDDVMENKPRDKKEGFFAHGLGFTIAWQGVMVGLLTLTSFFIGYFIHTGDDIEVRNNTAQTMAFMTLAMVQLFHAYNMKSDKSIFHKGIFHNRFLNFSFVLGMSLQMFILYVGHSLFKLTPLSFLELSITIGLSASVILILEIVKKIKSLKS